MSDRKKRISAPPVQEALQLEELMSKAGLKSLQDLANKMGIKRESLSRALKASPSYSMLYQMAEALGVTVQDLFRESAAPKHDIRGIVSFDGKTYIINSYDDLLDAGKEIREAYI